ncbi:hypothetical protein EC968_005272 [Mortierella alpina]|nr:hypothetical protein EC968_005272 [Mortierella alpina]
MSDRAWVTYLSNTEYLAGCLVLAYSLRKVQSRYPLVVMVPRSPPLAPSDLEQLNKTSNIIVEPIDISIWQLQLNPPSSSSPGGDIHTQTGSTQEEYLWDYYAHTWAKLGAWGLVQYRRLVLLDCDMLVRINMDQLLNTRTAAQVEINNNGSCGDHENERKLQLGHSDAYLDLPEDWVAAAHACTCNPMRKPKYPASWTPDSCAYSQYAGNPCPPSHNVVPAVASANGTPTLVPQQQQQQQQQQALEKKTDQQINDLQVLTPVSSTSTSFTSEQPQQGTTAAAHLSTITTTTTHTTSSPPKRSYFNSGLVVLSPSHAQLESILAVFRTVKSPAQYLFPDQDLLNEVFYGRWKSIGYGYNALKTLSFCHAPIWNEATSIPIGSIKDNSMPVVNVHYILEKPWNVKDLVKAEQESDRFVELYRWWWQAHDELRHEIETSA